jgi:hypothetical protein
MYTDVIFPEKEVRFIAINDGVDSANNTGNDFTPIRNLFNEFHARDTAKKVKDAMALKGKSGKYLATNPPYGYRKNPDNPKEWLIDQDAAEVVRTIYMLCMEGKGVTQIAKTLRSTQILTPAWYWREKGMKAGGILSADRYRWMPDTVIGILEKSEYVGEMVNFKTYRKNYKSHRKLDNPKENWLIFEDAHDAIIDRPIWERVQELRKNKRRKTKIGKTSIFSGVLVCADCGAKLYYCTSRVFSSNQDHFVCSNYKSNTGTCSAHFIREQVLIKVVLEHIQRALRYIQQFEASFVRDKYEQSFEDRRRELIETKRGIIKANSRIGELDTLFKHLYEDHVIGKLSDERFQAMSGGYETEQRQLKADVTLMETDVAKGEEVTADFQVFLANVRKYTDIPELTPLIVNEFIQKIKVHTPEKVIGKRHQDIEIFYNAVGVIDIPTPEELEALEVVARKHRNSQSA